MIGTTLFPRWPVVAAATALALVAACSVGHSGSGTEGEPRSSASSATPLPMTVESEPFNGVGAGDARAAVEQLVAAVLRDDEAAALQVATPTAVSSLTEFDAMDFYLVGDGYALQGGQEGMLFEVIVAYANPQGFAPILSARTVQSGASWYVAEIICCSDAG